MVSLGLIGVSFAQTVPSAPVVTNTEISSGSNPQGKVAPKKHGKIKPNHPHRKKAHKKLRSHKGKTKKHKKIHESTAERTSATINSVTN